MIAFVDDDDNNVWCTIFFAGNGNAVFLFSYGTHGLHHQNFVYFIFLSKNYKKLSDFLLLLFFFLLKQSNKNSTTFLWRCELSSSFFFFFFFFFWSSWRIVKILSNMELKLILLNITEYVFLSISFFFSPENLWIFQKKKLRFDFHLYFFFILSIFFFSTNKKFTKGNKTKI